MKRSLAAFILVMVLVTAQPLPAGARTAAAPPVPVLRLEPARARRRPPRRRNHYAGTLFPDPDPWRTSS